MSDLSPCPDCGGFYPVTDGAIHPYLGASAGCWAVYGEVLAREYSNAEFATVHRLTVDTYAAQHPGEDSPQSRKSTALHLIALHLALELTAEPDWIRYKLQVLSDSERDWPLLDIERPIGSLTVEEVQEAGDATEHAKRVRSWAESVWYHWQPHREQVSVWVQELLAKGP